MVTVKSQYKGLLCTCKKPLPVKQKTRGYNCITGVQNYKISPKNAQKKIHNYKICNIASKFAKIFMLQNRLV